MLRFYSLASQESLKSWKQKNFPPFVEAACRIIVYFGISFKTFGLFLGKIKTKIMSIFFKCLFIFISSWIYDYWWRLSSYFCCLNLYVRMCRINIKVVQVCYYMQVCVINNILQKCYWNCLMQPKSLMSPLKREVECVLFLYQGWLIFQGF